ncbi:MAG: peptidase U32 family protein [Acholeplasmataceae bacterium]
MKYLTTLHKLNNLENLLIADGYIVGNSLFSIRLPKSFNVEEINQIIKFSKDNQKEVYLTLNKMFYDEDFPKLDAFLDSILLDDLTGIIASDLGLVYYLINKKMASKVIWQGETLSTNQFDFNFLSQFNIKGSFVGKEITIEDILNIGYYKQYELFILGHGYYSMFYSKRKLISNFYEHYQLDINGNRYKYHLTETQRVTEKYPILEDENGTHVFRPNVTNSFEVLNKIKEVANYFVVDSLFKDDEYAKNIINLYKNGFDQKLVDQLMLEYNEEWDDGFYTNKTVYLKEDL